MEQSSITMINNVLKLKGKLQDYPKFVEDNLSKYRTLREFVNGRLQVLGVDKGEFAKSMGISHQDLNNWEIKGIPQYEKAIQLGLALGLDFAELNDFLLKYTEFRKMDTEQETKLLQGEKTRERGQAFLDEYVENSRFQKHNTRKEKYKLDSWKLDLLSKEDKDYYQEIYNKLGEEKKEDIIKLGLILRMTRTKLDAFLEKTGHYRLSAKNPYEGALILVLAYMEQVYPEQFVVFHDHYRPLDYRIMVTQYLSKCVMNIPKELQAHYKKKPKWYTTGKITYMRQKQRDAAIILDVEKHIFNTWLILREDPDQSKRLDCSVEDHVKGMLRMVEYEKLHPVKDAMVIKELKEIDRIWEEQKRTKKILELSESDFQEVYVQWLSGLKGVYKEKYSIRRNNKEESQDELQ